MAKEREAANYTPPANPEAEQAVLGAALIRPEVLDELGDMLRPGDFYREAHGRIYTAMLALYNANEPVDLVSVNSRLKELDWLESVGGPVFLAGLSDQVGFATNALYYARLVREKAMLRRLLDATQEIASGCLSPVENIGEFIDAAEQKIYHVKGDQDSHAVFTLSDVVPPEVEKLERLWQRKKEILGVPSGLKDLDAITGGWQNGDLILVGARPSMGKAQPVDAKIKTVNGWKLLKDLRFGENLASVDGHESRVVGLYPQGEKEVFHVTFSDGRATECCKEHLWKVYFRKWPSPRTLSTEEISGLLTKKQYQNRLWIDLPCGEFGNQKELPLDPWLLGAVLGNGDLNGSLRFSTPDAETIVRMNERIGYNMKVNYAGGYDYRVVTVGGCNRDGVSGVVPNEIKEKLKSLGLWGLKSTEKFIPESYLSASREERIEIIKGMIDTDGWVEKSGSVRFSTSSKKLAEDMVYLIRSIGGLCQIAEKQPTYSYKGERKIGADHYICKIRYHSPHELMYLHRKRKRAKNGRTPHLTFKSIEFSRRAETACIKVNHPSHLYITDDFVVTHNTALAVNNFAWHAVKNAGVPVAFFSLEQPKEQLSQRLMSNVGRINSWCLRTANLDGDGWSRLMGASGELMDAPMYIVDTPALSTQAIRSHARRLKSRHDVGLVIVDYLQLVRHKGTRSREQEISEISGALKGIAKELNLPVIALCQLNREVEKRPNKRPQLADLRESGSLEQDADVVAFIYRDEVYQEDSADKGIAEVRVAKQRNGPVGLVKLTYRDEYMRFNNHFRE